MVRSEKFFSCLFTVGIPYWLSDPATFEEYQRTLGLFREVARATRKCDLYLPYWMEKYEEPKERLVADWVCSQVASVKGQHQVVDHRYLHRSGFF